MIIHFSLCDVGSFENEAPTFIYPYRQLDTETCVPARHNYPVNSVTTVFALANLNHHKNVITTMYAFIHGVGKYKSIPVVTMYATNITKAQFSSLSFVYFRITNLAATHLINPFFN
jgi:hypothetical protein